MLSDLGTTFIRTACWLFWAPGSAPCLALQTLQEVLQRRRAGGEE